ncbi:MAG: ArsA-related P-loop ATPase [Patescibacteria group bacterium]
MKIAFVGKGGSGKTTLSALTGLFSAQSGTPTLMIDADINQHLIGCFGNAQSPLPLSDRAREIKTLLRGENPRIEAVADMINTTPPGRGSTFFTFSDLSQQLSEHIVTVGENLSLMEVGHFSQEDLGVRCYHAKVAIFDLLLSNILDRKNELLVADMTAGADAFASGIFTKFDVVFLVVEPTKRSLDVFAQYVRYTKEYPITLRVIGNKIQDAEDEAFIRDTVGNAYLGGLSQSAAIRGMERSGTLSLAELADEETGVLESVKKTVDETQPDWDARARYNAHFHEKNATLWANERKQKDLVSQIDPEFRYQDVLA